MRKFTPNMNDEELDRLFQEAANHYQPEGKEAGWEKVERQLDEAGITSGRRRLIIPWWQAAAAVGIAAISGIAFYHTEVVHKKFSLTISTNKNVNLKPASPNTQQSFINNNSSSQAGNVLTQKRSSVVPLPNQLANQNNQPLVQKPILPVSAISGTSLPGKTVSSIPANTQDENNQLALTMVVKQNVMNISDLVPLAGMVYSTPSPLLRPWSPLAIVSGKKGQPGNISGMVKLNKKSFRSVTPRNLFSFRLVAGPDWSTVKFEGWTKAGFDEGAMFGFHFASRWTVETGVLLANKLYASSPECYTPKHPMRDQDAIKEINADCSLIDVPLNIRFNALNGYNNKIFISTGLSSFWLKKEQFNYQYKRFSPGQEWTAKFDNDDQRILSILNLSAGYERNLTHHISLQAEPFLKLPLSAIGFGQVKLSSAGAFLSVKYKF